MAKATHKRRKSKTKLKVNVKQRVQIVHKDSDTVRSTRHAPTIVPNNGPVFRVKLRKKK